MPDPYRALAERESARADDRATAARAAATSATRATIARVASAAIAAAKAPDPNRALDDIRLAVQGARAADLDRAEQQALAALLAALIAGYLYDAAQRATLVASAALAVTVADDPPAPAGLAIAGYSAAQLARILRDQLARTIDRTLTLPLAGALPVEALPGALGQVADQHAARVAEAVDEGYHAGAKAAARDLGTAIRAAAAAHAGAPTADRPATHPSAPPAPEARQAGAGGPGRGGSGGGAGGSVSGSGGAGGIRVTITAPPVPAGARAPAGEVWFQYHTRMDNRVRPSHRALEGTVWRVDDITAPVPPIDWGCFLPETIVRGVFDGGSKGSYTGDAIEIRTKNGAVLRVTPNHPIPTDHGLVSANSIKPGWKLLRDLGDVVPIAAHHVNEQDKPARIEDVYGALAELGPIYTTGLRSSDFHGDGHAINGDVEVVGSYAVLGRVADTEIVEDARNGSLGVGLTSGSLPHGGLGEHGGEAGLLPGKLDSRSSIGGGDLTPPGIWAHLSPFDRLRFRLSAELYALGQQRVTDELAADAEALGYRIDGRPLRVFRGEDGAVQWRQMNALCFGNAPGFDACLYEPLEDRLALNAEFFADLPRVHPTLVEADDVVEVKRFAYSGHVYDLRSPFGYVIAGGIYASNCRCFTSFCQPPELDGAKLPPPEAPPDGTAADKKFGDEPHPVPRAEIYDVWLDQHVDGWRAILAAAKRAKPVDQLLVIVRELRATGRSAADARDVATMILAMLRG